jgi:putative ABC transport system permease protein
LIIQRAIRGVVQAVDPSVAVSQIRTMDSVIDASLAKPRFTTALVGALAMVTLLLGAVGVYGVMSNLVSQRTHEMGVRAALGATPSDIAMLVLRRAMVLTGAGALAGLIAASLITRLLPSLLFQVSPFDPVTFALVPLVFVAVSLAASMIPARRAVRCDPILALRGE